jgi:hypothetical protein
MKTKVIQPYITYLNFVMKVNIKFNRFNEEAYLNYDTLIIIFCL